MLLGETMNAQIASLHERMAQGGDWRAFRDEIAALLEQATTEAEYVALLEAHKNLAAVAKYAFDPESYEKLSPVVSAEYRYFLIKEATEGHLINPVHLERITRREVGAGRLSPDDDFRQHAVAGAQVLGDTAELNAHRCRRGDWFCYGTISASIVSAAVLPRLDLSPWWLIPAGLVAGWFLNEHERKHPPKASMQR